MADLAPIIDPPHLFEVTDINALVALISLSDSRGARAPLFLRRIPYIELMAADWELPHPDILIWIWQAARHDSAPCLISRPHGECAPSGDSQGLSSPSERTQWRPRP